MRARLPHFARGTSDSGGQALIEMAMTIMLLVILLTGVFDYSRAIHAQSIITNMSREGANLIARANQNLSGDEATDFQNVLDLVGKTAQPLDMVNKGMMYIYKVERLNGTNTTTSLAWNRSALSSKPSAAAGPGGHYAFRGTGGLRRRGLLQVHEHHPPQPLFADAEVDIDFLTPYGAAKESPCNPNRR